MNAFPLIILWPAFILYLTSRWICRTLVDCFLVSNTIEKMRVSFTYHIHTLFLDLYIGLACILQYMEHESEPVESMDDLSKWMWWAIHLFSIHYFLLLVQVVNWNELKTKFMDVIHHLSVFATLTFIFASNQDHPLPFFVLWINVLGIALGFPIEWILVRYHTYKYMISLHSNVVERIQYGSKTCTLLIMSLIYYFIIRCLTGIWQIIRIVELSPLSDALFWSSMLLGQIAGQIYIGRIIWVLRNKIICQLVPFHQELSARSFHVTHPLPPPHSFQQKNPSHNTITNDRSSIISIPGQIVS